jgi:succinate dehydrogenase/fumarate reductase flavoprotein subunit
MNAQKTVDVDFLVVGTGAAGMTAAITARKSGLDVLIVEKNDVYGGTSAASGGMIWVPGNKHSLKLAEQMGITPSAEKARAYIIEEAGNYANVPRIDNYLKYGPEMVDYMERESEVKFFALPYPDYHGWSKNASRIHSLQAMDYAPGSLGSRVAKMRNFLPQTLFLGFAIGSSVEMKLFMSAGRSGKAMAFVVKRLARHFADVLRFGAGQQMVRGRALIGRLSKTVFDLNIPLWLSSPAAELIEDRGRVVGALVDTPNGRVQVNARKGVLLASGGFPGDRKRRSATYPAAADAANHRGIWCPTNTGDGARMAEAVGATMGDVANPAAWIPVSLMPGKDGIDGVWPHFVDRNKPGFICVLRNGKRFTSEAGPYTDFIIALNNACERDKESFCWLISDQEGINKYGMGFARPRPLPRGEYLRNGYIKTGKTLRDLAQKIGVDADNLEKTVAEFNRHAVDGKDPEFHRGENLYDVYNGDDEHKPNPCIGPLKDGPYYAVRIVPGDLGTFAGLKADEFGRVLRSDGSPIAGLYTAGNDQASVWGGAYPGGGSMLGPGMTFGYIAARHAAGKLPEAA